MRNNVYDDVKILSGASVDPGTSLSSSGSATDGNSVDTQGADNAALYVRSAAASGSPSAFSIACKVQESADGSTNWTDALDNTGAAIGFTLDVHAAAAENLARIEGLNLNRKRYLRAVVTPTITGGSSPAAEVVALIIRGNVSPLPADSNASNT
jgi:hypothetical protein